MNQPIQTDDDLPISHFITNILLGSYFALFGPIIHYIILQLTLSQKGFFAFLQCLTLPLSLLFGILSYKIVLKLYFILVVAKEVKNKGSLNTIDKKLDSVPKKMAFVVFPIIFIIWIISGLIAFFTNDFSFLVLIFYFFFGFIHSCFFVIILRSGYFKQLADTDTSRSAY